MERKKTLTNKEIVEFLFKEKDIARQEVFLNIKAVNQVSLILLPFFFTGAGLLLGYGNVKLNIKSIDVDQFSLLLAIISQIMFLLWMYGLSIVSNMAALAGYIMALEEKINHFANDDISLWEMVIQTKYVIKFKSGQFISTFFWNFFYFVLFVWMTVIIYAEGLKEDIFFFILNCFEMITIIIIFSSIIHVRKKAYNLSKLKSPRAVFQTKPI